MLVKGAPGNFYYYDSFPGRSCVNRSHKHHIKSQYVKGGFVSLWSVPHMSIELNTLKLRQDGRHLPFSQTTFSNAFSWMKIFEFRLKFHWSLFLMVQLTIFQHWFRYWLGAAQSTSYCLNQWCLVCRRVYASLGLNELRFLPYTVPINFIKLVLKETVSYPSFNLRCYSTISRSIHYKCRTVNWKVCLLYVYISIYWELESLLLL